MRVLFAGTPAFAATSLEALLASGHDVVAVLTQPDRPAGRGKKVLPGLVKQSAVKAGVAVLQPDKLDQQALALLERYRPDVLVVVAYGLLLPPWLLELAPWGALNVHASLLPRWRGAAPIQRAIMAGDHETGICLMQMDHGLDTGPVLAQLACPIEDRDTSASLHDRLATLGARLLVETLNHLDERLRLKQSQSEEGVMYAHKIRKEEAIIDWHADADVLDRMIRAFIPAPVARTMRHGEALMIREAQVMPESRESPSGLPGQVLRIDDEGIEVLCGRGGLRILRLQRPGGKVLSVREFCTGVPLQVGERWGMSL